jgi:hypothetical protein
MKRQPVMRTRMTIAVIFAALAACGGGSPDAPGASDPGRSRVTAPIRFTARLRVADRPLQQGDSVRNGDHVQAFVTAAQDAYLYLGFCDQHQFQLFPAPPRPPVRAAANQETKIPDGESVFEIMSDSTSEVLYLILSTEELSQASPELAVKIATSGAPADGDCAGPMLGSDRQPLPPGAAGAARPGNGGLEVMRYTFKHQVATVPPGQVPNP